jgi:hypothetical protein
MRRKQLFVAEVVERRDERQHEQRQPCGEQQRPAPGRVIRTAAAEADEGLGEKHERKCRADQDRRRRLPGAERMGKRHRAVSVTV